MLGKTSGGQETNMIRIIIFIFIYATFGLHADEPWSNIATIQDDRLPEISGIDQSSRKDLMFWMINDSGNKPWLFGVSGNGSIVEKFKMPFKNKDWEDLCCFQWKSSTWIMIGDIGDNRGQRKDIELYCFKEPQQEQILTKEDALSVHLTYPDGPRDAESLAIDEKNLWVYILSKREEVTSLYRFPLRQMDSETDIVLEKYATLTTIPQPTDEVKRELFGPFRSQPTAMDIDSATLRMLVLTYQDAYIFDLSKPADEFGTQIPITIALPDQKVLQQRESICWSSDGKTLYVVSEGESTPLIQVDVDKE